MINLLHAHDLITAIENAGTTYNAGVYGETFRALLNNDKLERAWSVWKEQNPHKGATELRLYPGADPTVTGRLFTITRHRTGGFHITA